MCSRLCRLLTEGLRDFVERRRSEDFANTCGCLCLRLEGEMPIRENPGRLSAKSAPNRLVGGRLMSGRVFLITAARGGVVSFGTKRVLAAGATVVGVDRSISQKDFAAANFVALPADL